jgi:hypothetical protein
MPIPETALMADAHSSRTTIGGSGSVIVRQRPSLLVMLLPLRSSAPTLELRLDQLKKQCEGTAQWLKRLGAASVEFGEPHFADQIGKGPLQAVRAAAARALGKGPADPASEKRRGEVTIVATAQWEIAAMSPEETLLLVDRLRFEAAEDAATAEPAEETPAWSSPEEQLRQAMARMQAPLEDDRSPQILFVARLDEGQLERATTEAFAIARRAAERLARAAGLDLARLSMVHTSGGPGTIRPEKLMERQRCAALIAGSTYVLRDNEVVSDDSRPAELTVSVNVSYHVQQAAAENLAG